MIAGGTTVFDGANDVIETPEIAETSRRLVARIHLTIPRHEMRFAIGPALGEIHAAIKGQGGTVAGAWFTHHLKIEPAIFDFEICIPVAAPIVGKARVEAGEIPALRVVRTVYQGPYEGLGGAWRELDAWISAQGIKVGEDLYECYPVGPESGLDPHEWRTELSRRIE